MPGSFLRHLCAILSRAIHLFELSPPTRDLRALWRLPLFGAILLVLFTTFGTVLRQFPSFPSNPNSPALLFVEESVSFAGLYAASWILSRIERTPLAAYGLPAATAFGKHFWQGCLFGLCEISLLMALIAAFGGYSFGSWSLSGVAVLRWSGTWAVIFLFVGLYEEFAFRGYVLHALTHLVGFWPAAFLLALLFGGVHAWNPGESRAGEFGVFCIALLFALALRRTGSLWLAVGWHAAFDFGETFLFSVPDSGAVFPGHLSNAYLHGPTWKTGGPAGPEASVFSFVVMALLAVVFHLLYPPALAPPLSPPRAEPPLPLSLAENGNLPIGASGS
jgi:CAAX protease family protein